MTDERLEDPVGVLLLVRHGQASFGAADYDVLSDRGAEQARVLGTRLAPVAGSVTRVLSGGLVRQRDTARHLAEAMGLEPDRLETDPRWDEYDSLDVLTGIPAEPVADGRALQALLDAGLRRWTSGEHDGDYAETWPAYRQRVRAALAEATSGPGTTVVVSSAGTIGATAAEVLGSPVFIALARVMVNASLTKVVTGRSGTSLLAFNDHAHLEPRPELVTYR